MNCMRIALLPTLAIFVNGATAAQTPSIRISMSPDLPVHGTLFEVRAVPLHAGVAAVTGSIAGEPLHFTRTLDGAFSAMAAAPLDFGAALRVGLAVIHGNGVIDTISVPVNVASGTYPLERLRVAPRFGAPPDSAAQIRLERDRARAAQVSRNAHSTPRLWADVTLPRNTRITSAFGSGREFNGQIQSRHTGTDLAGVAGAPVVATARGVIALVDTFFLAGNVIYIDHGEGLVSAYFHLSAQDVMAGDTVEAGQPIGKVGATGRVTGPHLHWVVRYGAISVDPMSLIGFAKATRPATRPDAS
jgi:murein DD-endopeptidase MepM/ murein hydrolase activator NlpD